MPTSLYTHTHTPRWECGMCLWSTTNNLGGWGVDARFGDDWRVCCCSNMFADERTASVQNQERAFKPKNTIIKITYSSTCTTGANVRTHCVRARALTHARTHALTQSLTHSAQQRDTTKITKTRTRNVTLLPATSTHPPWPGAIPVHPPTPRRSAMAHRQ